MMDSQRKTRDTTRRQIRSDIAWKKNYRNLCRFFSIYKHSKVPYRYNEEPALGRWVQKQRMSKNKLSKEKIGLLNKINFVWQEDIRKERNKRWLLMFKSLEKFKKEKGNCDVPSKYIPDEELGRWVEVIRTRRQYLEDWKLKKLQSIGFKWSEDIQIEKSKHWYEMYRRLEKFYQKYKHSNVPEYWEEDKELSIWVISQRRPKKPLSTQKVKLLNELKFSWNNTPIKRTRDRRGRFISGMVEKIPLVVINKNN